MKGIFFYLLIVLFSSCASDYGHKVVGDHLTVYFTNRNDEQLAADIALFWKKNQLIATHKQDLQLVRLDENVQLRIISNMPETVKNMSFEERKLLSELEQEIQDKTGEQSLQLVICNDKFEPIYIPTE